MSFHIAVYIGPYAQWLVRRGRKPPRKYSEEPWYDSLIEEGGILDLESCDGLPEVKVGRVRYTRYRFTPKQDRSNHPPRQMYFHDGFADGDQDDWSWIVPKMEMDWFLETFAPELAILAAHFGSDPTPGWGAFTMF
jgi:hypothetical protein